MSTNIPRTLQERDWVRVVGHRDVPGRPARDAAAARTFLGVPGHLATMESKLESEFVFENDQVYLAPDMAPRMNQPRNII